MTNKEAYERAKAALDAAFDDSENAYVGAGEGWGSMASHEIYNHIEAFVAHAFRQGPAPKLFKAEEDV